MPRPRSNPVPEVDARTPRNVQRQRTQESSPVVDQVARNIERSAPQDAASPESLVRKIFGGVVADSVTDEELNNILNEAQSLSDTSNIGKGLKMEVTSIDKGGKTHLAMTAGGLVEENPKLDPLVKILLHEGVIPKGQMVHIIDTELKARKLKYKFQNTGKSIKIYPIFYPSETNPYRADPVKSLLKLAKILTAINMKYPNEGTIVIDSATDVNDWVVSYLKYCLVQRGAPGKELGELIRPEPSDWMVRDDIWSYILRVMQIMNHHFVFTAREKEDWSFEKDENGNIIGKTGNYSARHYKELPFAVDMHLSLRPIYDDQGNRIGREGVIVSNQYEDPELNGKRIENPTFPKIMGLIAPICYAVEIKKLGINVQQFRSGNTPAHAPAHAPATAVAPAPIPTTAPGTEQETRAIQPVHREIPNATSNSNTSETISVEVEDDGEQLNGDEGSENEPGLTVDGIIDEVKEKGADAILEEAENEKVEKPGSGSGND